MKLWSALTALVIAAVCSVNVIRTAQRLSPPPHYGSAAPADIVMRHEARFSRVRQSLEKRGVHGRIGYVADTPAERLAGDEDGMRDYFLTQFALAPRVLETGPENGGVWAVANLRTTSMRDRMPPGFELAEDCGDGVLLLRKTRAATP